MFCARFAIDVCFICDCAKAIPYKGGK